MAGFVNFARLRLAARFALLNFAHLRLAARFACGAVAALLLAAALPACASVDATRLARSGTDALDRGDPAHAIADLERAAALAPEVSGIQNHLGIAYEQVGRRDDALRAYERAVALDCDNAAAESNLEALQHRPVTEMRR